jgi:hypothetical protein
MYDIGVVAFGFALILGVIVYLLDSDDRTAIKIQIFDIWKSIKDKFNS